jgi:hypothetical protein
MIKAWLVFGDWNDTSGIVFAETRNEARALAYYTDAIDPDTAYIDIHARRAPYMDGMDRGRVAASWDDPDDRFALVKHGWACGEDCYDRDECEKCCAKEACWRYEEEDTDYDT